MIQFIFIERDKLPDTDVTSHDDHMNNMWNLWKCLFREENVKRRIGEEWDNEERWRKKLKLIFFGWRHHETLGGRFWHPSINKQPNKRQQRRQSAAALQFTIFIEPEIYLMSLFWWCEPRYGVSYDMKGQKIVSRSREIWDFTFFSSSLHILPMNSSDTPSSEDKLNSEGPNRRIIWSQPHIRHWQLVLD